MAKKEGVSRHQVIKLLQLIDENNYIGLSSLEKAHKWRIDEIHGLDMQIERSKKHLHEVNDEIVSAKALLSSYHILCERKRQEVKNINSEASRIVTLINRFRSNNEEYLKIKKTVEEEVKSVLTDSKVLLQFSLASVIEAIRKNPDKYNNLLGYDLPSSGSLLYIEDYKDTILDEAKRLYDILLKHFTNTIMDSTVGASSSSTFPNLSVQTNT